MPTAIADAEFEAKVIKSDLPVLVDFWAPWCGPCRSMHPIVEELEQAYEGRITFVTMNVDENSMVPSMFNVMSIPTFILFKEGKVVQQFSGARSKADMQRELDAVLVKTMRFVLGLIGVAVAYGIVRYREMIGDMMGGRHQWAVGIGVIFFFWSVAYMVGAETFFLQPILWILPMGR